MKQIKAILVYKKQILQITLLICLTGITLAQNTDSLKNTIRSQSDDAKKLETLYLLCDQSASLHPDTLQVYINLAKKIIAKTGNEDAALKMDY